MLLRATLIAALASPMAVLAQEVVPHTEVHIEQSGPAVPDDPDHIFKAVQKMPSFPGGIDSLRAFMTREVRYPEEAAEEGGGGRVFIAFTVERDGSLNDVRVIRGTHPLLDREAIRAIKAMPRWVPGEQDGVPVRVEQTLPVTFVSQR